MCLAFDGAEFKTALDEMIKDGETAKDMPEGMAGALPEMMMKMMPMMMKSMMEIMAPMMMENKTSEIDEDPDNKSEDKDPDNDTEDGKGEDVKHLKDELKKAQDAIDELKSVDTRKEVLKEISARDSLVAKASVHIGAFDAADKSLVEVQDYVAKKLGLDCEDGQSGAAVDAALKVLGNKSSRPVSMISSDGDDVSAGNSIFDNYLKGA